MLIITHHPLHVSNYAPVYRVSMKRLTPPPALLLTFQQFYMKSYTARAVRTLTTVNVISSIRV